MTNTLIPTLRPLAVVMVALFLLCSVAYPLAVTGIGQLAFERQADGSLIERDGEAIGSSLIGQAFTSEAYFHGRPSAAGDGYDASSGSGSNLGPTSQKLADRLTEDGTAFREANGLDAGDTLPADAITASGSGLDPHISVANARLQVERVATARGATAEDVRMLLDEYTEGRPLGFLGESRVNVLKLNIALDERFPLEQ